ncbi:MAG: hypothetical protein FRX49_06110 [Trebouxia sp. A1-2]|nr:MAG: hypothetical protein FRX49_06110 [Trebouxia sp. A1-2]
MDAELEVVENDTDGDAVSCYSEVESSEDVLASFWRQYSIKYAPVYTFKVKPTHDNNRWMRKIKVYPDKQEIKVYGKRWSLWGWCHLQLRGEWDWSSGRRYPLLEYSVTTKWENDAHNLSSKFNIPRAPSLVQLRPHWNVKKHLPSMSGRLGGDEGDAVAVTQPYCHAKIPRMELVVTPGKASNWRSIWPPTNWFGSKKTAAQRKLQWEESLDHDSRKDQFLRSLSEEDRVGKYKPAQRAAVVAYRGAQFFNVNFVARVFGHN